MNLNGSETEKNLLRAFAGESRARNRYQFYAEKARIEGYEWIARIFEETAENEFAHAREIYVKYLKMIEPTLQNLYNSAMGEKDEYEIMYKRFEDEARKEGFLEIAEFFKELRDVEEEHSKGFLEIYKNLKSGNIYKKDKECTWKCLNCGYIYEGNKAPEKCPLCKYSKNYYKRYCDLDKE